MLDAHVTSLSLLATPFKETTAQPFAFGPGSSWAEVTAQIRAQIPVMLHERLTPPPRETYSLNRCVCVFVCAWCAESDLFCFVSENRKLSGAFLLAARLDAEVDCRKLWRGVVDSYRFADSSSSSE